MRRASAARPLLVLGLLTAALAGALVLGVLVGPAALPSHAALEALFGRGDAAAVDIVRGIRLPRALLAAAVGAALSTAGVVFQGLLRNPLADPFVLGVSGGAALGAVAVLSLGGAVGLGATAAPPAAFAGALAATALLLAIAGVRGRLGATTLLLAGVVFNAFASAAIVFLASLGGLLEGATVFLWLVGSLAAARAEALPVVAVLLALGLVAALACARALDLLALDEESALHLGVPVEPVKRVLLAATSLMVGAAVAVSGLIGFVGLIVPHALRLLVGPRHRLLLPAAALGGAAFLVLCDTAARVALGGRELPVGAITALAGGPLFLVLLRRRAARGELA